MSQLQAPPLQLHVYQNAAREWVFDDPARDLVQEPFVEGVPEIIEWCLRRTGHLGHALRDGFTLTFSDEPFPVPDGVMRHALIRLENRGGGAAYFHQLTGLEGWLCPALLLYFKSPPENIYFTVRV